MPGRMERPVSKATSGSVPLRRAPLVLVAAALSAGIVLGSHALLPLGFWALAGAGALVAAAVTFRKKHLHLLSGCLLAGAVLAGGAVHGHLAYFNVADDHIVTYTRASRMLATFRGRIVTAPKTFDVSAGLKYGYRPGARTSMLVEASSIRTGRTWQPASGLVRVVIKQPDRRLAAGQEVELAGWIYTPRGPDNPGQYDWAERARRAYVLARMDVESAGGVTILSGAERPWYGRLLWRLRAGMKQHLATTGQDRGSHLLTALLVGERSPALRSLNDAMVRAGIAHFLSISGLHLGVFLGFVYLLCRLAMFSPRRSAATVLVVLGAYMVLAEPRAPLLRSAMMAVSLCLATICHRRHSSLNALAGASIVLLAIDPLQLFSAAFQLSFGIVAGLVLLNRPVETLLFGRWKRRRGLMVFRGDQRLRRWLWYSAGNWATGAVAMVVTAYIVAAPLVAYHFGLFCPYAPLLSLLLLPLVVAVLIPGYLSMALLWPMPNLAHAFASLGARAGEALGGVVDLAERYLPGMSFELRPVGPVSVALCYAALLAVVFHRRLRRGRLWSGVFAAAAAGLIVYTQLPSPSPGAAELHLLAVGAGQCVVLRTPSGKTYIIDAGAQGGLDVYGRVLGPFLKDRRFPSPVAAFISHANSDHYSAMTGLLKHRRLAAVYVNEYFGRAGTRKAVPAAEAEILGELIAGADRLIRLGQAAGRKIVLDDRTSVEVLWPPPGRADLSGKNDVNNTSFVLRITCDDKSVLLPADVEAAAQAELAGQDIRADVLVMPHHGSWRATLSAFVAAVAPEAIIISTDCDPAVRFGVSPERRAFFRRLKKSTGYSSTAADGWIRVRFGSAGVDVRTMRP